MLKQAPKARNHLKRVAKLPFSADMVDDFERGWLMLADVYINGGKCVRTIIGSSRVAPRCRG